MWGGGAVVLLEGDFTTSPRMEITASRLLVYEQYNEMPVAVRIQARPETLRINGSTFGAKLSDTRASNCYSKNRPLIIQNRPPLDPVLYQCNPLLTSRQTSFACFNSIFHQRLKLKIGFLPSDIFRKMYCMHSLPHQTCFLFAH